MWAHGKGRGKNNGGKWVDAKKTTNGTYSPHYPTSHVTHTYKHLQTTFRGGQTLQPLGAGNKPPSTSARGPMLYVVRGDWGGEGFSVSRQDPSLPTRDY